MPNRIIKESICTSEDIESLSDGAECFFFRLIVNCDDYGLMDARMPILKAKCYPLKSIDISLIQLFLTELESNGLISLYEVNEKPFLKLESWLNHQQVRAKKAKFPTPEQGEPITCEQLISSDRKCHRNPIQSNPIQSNPTTPTNVGVVRAQNKNSRSGTKTRCPRDFQPEEKAREWIRSFGITLEQAGPIIVEFRNYWCERTTLRADWSLTFMRNPKVEASLIRMRDRDVKNATDSESRTRGQRIHEKLKDIAQRDLNARAVASRNGDSDGEVLNALSPQMGQRD